MIGEYLTLLHDNEGIVLVIYKLNVGKGEGLISNFKFYTSLTYRYSGKQLQAFHTKDSIFLFVCIIKCLIDCGGGVL